MKATGVVRRIDELGRIVIPKEIRKNMRIREGENIEIYTDTNDEIVLRKYSIMKKLGDFAQVYADSINNFLKKNVIITDSDNIIAASGELKRNLMNKELSDELINSIKRRESILEKHMKTLKLTEELSLDCTYVIDSIICNGDSVGLVLIFSKIDKISEIDEKIVQIAAEFLSKYLEA